MTEKKLYSICCVVLLPLMIASGILFTHKFLVVPVIIILFLLSWLVSKYELQVLLSGLIVVLLPFSFEIALTNNLNISVPAEPLLAVAVFTMAWDFSRNPLYFKHLFSGESLWILPLLGCYLLTTLFSTMHPVSVKFTLVNTTYILVFFIWQKYLFEHHAGFFHGLIKLYSISFAVVLIYAIIRLGNYGWNPVTVKGIFTPFYKDNTIFGATAAILAAYWSGYSFVRQLPTTRILSVIAGTIFLLATILSSSRAAILSIMFFLLVFILLLAQVKLKYIVIAACLTLIPAIAFRQKVVELLREDRYLSHNPGSTYFEQLKSSGNISSDISNMERLNRWAAGLGMFADKPLTGFGPGTYQFTYIPFQKDKFKNNLTVKDPWHIPVNSGGTAHSEYILALSEMGVFGITALLIFIGRLWAVGFTNIRNNQRRLIIIIAFGALSTFFFHAFFNNFLNTAKFAFLFWSLAAWMLFNYEKKSGNEQRVLS